jgi:osmotically-inducible protein OsmY
MATARRRTGAVVNGRAIARLALPVLLPMLLPLMLGGCLPGMLIGGGAAVGVAAAEEHGVSGAATDLRIQADINDKWLRASMEIESDVGLTIHEGRVLLTGKVRTPELRMQAVQLVWEVVGVREVIDEIQVAEAGGVGEYARDVAISTELRSRLLFDRNIQSINYSVETVAGTVYLMGIAQNQAELERVTAHARNIGYVKRVVSFVRLKQDRIPPIPDAPPVTRPAPPV